MIYFFASLLSDEENQPDTSSDTDVHADEIEAQPESARATAARTTATLTDFINDP
jgi:hypothetical protein